MKILVKNRRFNGGGSRSMLEFLKVIISSNEIHVYGQYVEEPLDYLKNGIYTYNSGVFNILHPIKNLKLVRKYLTLIRRENFDLIIATGTECYLLKLISKVLNIKVLYMWQGGVIRYALPKFLKNEKIIVFSRENKNQLLHYGYSSDNIDVISNRIVVDSAICEAKKSITNHLKICIISRIDNDKFPSIKNFIEELDMLSNLDISVDIYGDGNAYEKLEDFIVNVRTGMGKVKITLKGYIEDVKLIIPNYDVFVGKGRSVIEPYLHNKISFVVNNRGHLSLINDETYENLAFYNFSGRNMENRLSVSQLQSIFEQIMKNEYKHKNDQAKIFIDDNYNSEYLREKFMDALTTLTSVNQENKRESCILSFIRLYFLFAVTFILEIIGGEKNDI